MTAWDDRDGTRPSTDEEWAAHVDRTRAERRAGAVPALDRDGLTALEAQLYWRLTVAWAYADAVGGRACRAAPADCPCSGCAATRAWREDARRQHDNPNQEHTMPTEIPVQIDRQGAFTALLAIVVGFRDGTLDNAQAARLLDDLVQTGPWDSIDDPVFLGLVDALDSLVPDEFSLWTALDRDPNRMRLRAAAAEDSNPDRAARIRERADRVEARRTTRA